jgi:hypothetical protein
MVLARAASPGDGKDESDVNRIDLLACPHTDGPGKATLTQGLSERCGEAIAGIGQYTAEMQARDPSPIDLVKRGLRLGPIDPVLIWLKLKLPRFGGHPPCFRERCPDAENPPTLCP